MGAFNVMPNDQHLKTAEGVQLNDNEATLADLAILPDTLILAKVSKKNVLTYYQKLIKFNIERIL